MRRRFCPCPPATGIILLIRLPVGEDAHGLVEPFGARRWIVVCQPAPHELSYGVRANGRVLAGQCQQPSILARKVPASSLCPEKRSKLNKKIDRVLPSFLSKIDAAFGVRSAILYCPPFARRVRAEGWRGFIAPGSRHVQGSGNSLRLPPGRRSCAGRRIAWRRRPSWRPSRLAACP